MANNVHDVIHSAVSLYKSGRAGPEFVAAEIGGVRMLVSRDIAERRRQQVQEIAQQIRSEVTGFQETAGGCAERFGCTVQEAIMLLALGRHLGFWKVVLPGDVPSLHRDFSEPSPAADYIQEAHIVFH